VRGRAAALVSFFANRAKQHHHQHNARGAPPCERISVDERGPREAGGGLAGPAAPKGIESGGPPHAPHTPSPAPAAGPPPSSTMSAGAQAAKAIFAPAGTAAKKASVVAEIGIGLALGAVAAMGFKVREMLRGEWGARGTGRAPAASRPPTRPSPVLLSQSWHWSERAKIDSYYAQLNAGK